VPTWLIVVLAVFALLAAGGMLARFMQLRRTREEFERRLERANHDLAEAAAQDRGWDRATLESAAQRIYADQAGGAGAVPALLLVEVLDRPGTDQDQAVFRVGDHDSERHLTLGRRDGEWVHESLG
jgi:Tfp pilus assembly protein PilX